MKRTIQLLSGAVLAIFAGTLIAGAQTIISEDFNYFAFPIAGHAVSGTNMTGGDWLGLGSGDASGDVEGATYNPFSGAVGGLDLASNGSYVAL